MLSGPQKDDYFSDGHHLRGGFPTPNESSIRSGLTPGGGGSMFPEPSPNTQALFNSLASGGATPNTIDFHRTALNAAAARQQQYHNQNITSQPQVMNPMVSQATAVGPMDGNGNDANDAANGLFLLAQSQAPRNGIPQTSHYAPVPPMAVHSQPVINMGGNSHEASPTMANHHIGSISTTSGRGGSELSDENEQKTHRPNTRQKGKRNSSQVTHTNGRKADAAAKGNKKAKGNNGHSMSMVMSPEPQMSEEEQDMTKEEYNANGKKMTDEEKRKNFLERNRYVASSTYIQKMY